MLRSFSRDEAGATAIEYGLMASLVVVAMIGAVEGLGGGVTNLYEWAYTVVAAITG